MLDMFVAPKSNDTNLSDLLKDANSGKMQLPEFQRSWTWDDERIRGILASLSQNYPMGAIMLLQYGNPEIKLKYRLLEGVHDIHVVPESLILDGQQRMTSIYLSAFCKDPVHTVDAQKNPRLKYYYFDMEKCVDSYIDRFDAILAVPEDKKVKTDFDRKVVLDLSTRQKEYEHKAFPVNIIFDSNERVEWLLGYMKYYESHKREQELFNNFNKEIIETITSYKLPVIQLDKSTPREAVCKVFENVNTGGVPLTVFELVTAAYATQSFNLRDDWRKCRNVIRGKGETLRTDLFDGIDETAFLTTVTLYTSFLNKIDGKSGMVSCKKKDVLSLPFESYQKNRDAVLRGFNIARNFLLNYQCVYRLRDLPYTTQIIPLAAICAYLGENKCNEPRTLKILSRWYWCGILGEMYGGANETRYANDIEDVVNEVQGKNSLNRTLNNAFFSSTRLLTLQTRLSAAYKGIMALIYKAQCEDFVNGITVNKVSAMIKSPDIHHIFPQKYCLDNGIKKERWNSIVNKTPLLPESNRAIGGQAPSQYLLRILKRNEDLSESVLRKRITSHFINYDALKENDFDTCFIDRAKKLLDLIDGAMGKKVADREAENTIKQFGASLKD